MKRGLFLLFVLVSGICHSALATEVQEVTSPKGIKAWLVEEHTLPLVAVKVSFTGAGFAYDTKGKEGRTGMVSAMLLEGAGDMSSKAFNEALEDGAIQLNFATDEDLFRASLESLSEHREKAFSLLGLSLTKPRFDDEAIDRVRSQSISILTQQEQEPGYILQRKWQQMTFANHAYSTPVLGTSESLRTLAKNDLAEFTRRYLTRENILIAVVGDITPKELGRLLDDHLSALPTHYDPEMTMAEAQLPATAKQETVDYDIPQTMVIFGTQGIKRSDPNYFAGYIMNQILGGGSLSAKLAVEIREKKGLAYSVYSQLDPMLHGGEWRGGFSTRNEKVGEALETLRATLKDFSQNGPTDKELADAKTYITGSFVLGLDSNADIANYLISMQLHKLGHDYFDKRNAMIEAVKKEDVRAMAKQLTDPDKLLVVMVGKPNLAKP